MLGLLLISRLLQTEKNRRRRKTYTKNRNLQKKTKRERESIQIKLLKFLLLLLPVKDIFGFVLLFLSYFSLHSKKKRRNKMKKDPVLEREKREEKIN